MLTKQPVEAKVIRRIRFLVIVGLVVGLVGIVLVWRTEHNGEFAPDSSLVPPPTHPESFASSPLPHPTSSALNSPLPASPTIEYPVNTATLEAIRTIRPSATPLSPSGIHMPHISPDTWRSWAFRVLTIGGLLAYLGLRLSRNQKT